VESAPSEDAILKPRGELTKEISCIAQENKELRDELRLKNVVIDRYEDELKRYRSAAFLDRDFKWLAQASNTAPETRDELSSQAQLNKKQ